jgi:hypothetical protein
MIDDLCVLVRIEPGDEEVSAPALTAPFAADPFAAGRLEEERPTPRLGECAREPVRDVRRPFASERGADDDHRGERHAAFDRDAEDAEAFLEGVHDVNPIRPG